VTDRYLVENSTQQRKKNAQGQCHIVVFQAYHKSRSSMSCMFAPLSAGGGGGVVVGVFLA